MYATTAIRIGTITRSSADSGESWRNAMITPPTQMIGAEIIMVKLSSTTIWTCWTSLVVRVIREGAPNFRPPGRRTHRPSRRSRPDVAAEGHGRPCSEVDRADRTEHLDQCDGEHDPADPKM